MKDVNRTTEQLIKELTILQQRIAELEASETTHKRRQRSLCESDEFYSLFLNNFPSPILVSNPDSSIRYVNTALEDITGFSSTEIIGMKAPYPWWTGKTQQEAIRDLKKAMHMGTRRIEEIFQKKNGELFWVEITSKSVKNNREFTFYIENWTDITRKRKAEEVLLKHREDWHKILDIMPTMVFYKDKENRYIYVNKATAQILGLAKEDLEGKSSFEIFPNQAQACWKHDKIVLESRKPIRSIIEFLETPLGKKWIVTDKLPIMDENGNIDGILGFSIDITEQKMAEKALRESKRELQKQKKF